MVIGIPFAGQAAGGHDGLVGHCVNVLPLRATIDPQATFGSVLERVRGELLLTLFADTSNTVLGRSALFARLALPRDPGRLPLVSVLFNLDFRRWTRRPVSFPRVCTSTSRQIHAAFENFWNCSSTRCKPMADCAWNASTTAICIAAARSATGLMPIA